MEPGCVPAFPVAVAIAAVCVEVEQPQQRAQLDVGQIADVDRERECGPGPDPAVHRPVLVVAVLVVHPARVLCGEGGSFAVQRVRAGILGHERLPRPTVFLVTPAVQFLGAIGRRVLPVTVGQAGVMRVDLSPAQHLRGGVEPARLGQPGPQWHGLACLFGSQVEAALAGLGLTEDRQRQSTAFEAFHRRIPRLVAADRSDPQAAPPGISRVTPVAGGPVFGRLVGSLVGPDPAEHPVRRGQLADRVCGHQRGIQQVDRCGAEQLSCDHHRIQTVDLTAGVQPDVEQIAVGEFIGFHAIRLRTVRRNQVATCDNLPGILGVRGLQLTGPVRVHITVDDVVPDTLQTFIQFKRLPQIVVGVVEEDPLVVFAVDVPVRYAHPAVDDLLRADRLVP